MAGCVGGGGFVGGGGLVGGGGFVGGIICGVGDKNRVGSCNVGSCAVGKPPWVGNNGVIPSGVTLGKKPPNGVAVGGRGVAVTTCGPPSVTVGAGVGVRTGAVPHRKNPAQ